VFYFVNWIIAVILIFWNKVEAFVENFTMIVILKDIKELF